VAYVFEMRFDIPGFELPLDTLGQVLVKSQSLARQYREGQNIETMMHSHGVATLQGDALKSRHSE
jgi:hypothetical protein